MDLNRSRIIVKNTGFLYFRMLFNLAVALYTSRVVLDVLGTDDFGIYNVVAGVIVMFSFLTYSLSSSMNRFLSFELGRKDLDQLGKVFNMSFSIYLLIAAVIFLLGETVGLWFVENKLIIPSDRMHAAVTAYHLSVLNAVLGIINVPFTAIIMARERMGLLAKLSVAETFLKLVIVYLLLYLSYDKLILYASLTCIVSFIVLLIYHLMCRKNFLETRFNRLIWDKDLFKQIGGFASWIMSGNLAIVGYGQGVNILLNLFFGPSVNAARGIAMQVQQAVLGFSTNFLSSVNPQLTKSYAAGDLAFMHKLIIAGSKGAFLLLFIISLPLVIEAPFVLSQWLTTVPVHSVSFVRMGLIIALITTLSNPLVIAVHATGKVRKFQIVEGAVLLSIVPIAYICLKSGLPAESVYVVHFVIALLMQVVRVAMVLPMINMLVLDYVKRVVLRMLPCLLLAIPVAAIPYCTMAENWSRLCATVAMSVLAIVLFAYLLCLDEEERRGMKSLFKRFF